MFSNSVDVAVAMEYYRQAVQEVVDTPDMPLEPAKWKPPMHVVGRIETTKQRRRIICRGRFILAAVIVLVVMALSHAPQGQVSVMSPIEEQELLEWAAEEYPFSMITVKSICYIESLFSDKRYCVGTNEGEAISELATINLTWTNSTIMERIAIIVRWQSNL